MRLTAPHSHRRTFLAVAAVVAVSFLVAFATVGSLPSRWSEHSVALGDPTFAASVPEPDTRPPADPTAVEEPPGDAGPYAVGVVTALLVDDARGTLARGGRPARDDRPLTTTIRYPADGAADASERTAPAAKGAFPLIVLAHGAGGGGEDYAPLAHALAASGFVVAAPEFPASSRTLPGEPDRSDVREQARDLSFVITALSDPQQRPIQIPSVVNQPVAVIGHSDGGITAALAAYASCCADARIGAAVLLSGARTDADTDWFVDRSPALLAIHGDADEVNPPGASATLYQGATGPRWLVSIPGGSHATPFTTDAVESGVAAVVVDFLRAILGRDPAARARIDIIGPLAAGPVVVAHD